LALIAPTLGLRRQLMVLEFSAETGKIAKVRVYT